MASKRAKKSTKSASVGEVALKVLADGSTVEVRVWRDGAWHVAEVVGLRAFQAQGRTSDAAVERLLDDFQYARRLQLV